MERKQTGDDKGVRSAELSTEEGDMGQCGLNPSECFGQPPVFQVKLGGSEMIKEHQDRTLVLMWPDFLGKGSFGLQALEEYAGEFLILVGEWKGRTWGAYTPELDDHGQSFSQEFQVRAGERSGHVLVRGGRGDQITVLASVPRHSHDLQAEVSAVSNGEQRHGSVRCTWRVVASDGMSGLSPTTCWQPSSLALSIPSRGWTWESMMVMRNKGSTAAKPHELFAKQETTLLQTIVFEVNACTKQSKPSGPAHRLQASVRQIYDQNITFICSDRRAVAAFSGHVPAAVLTPPPVPNPPSVDMKKCALLVFPQGRLS
eukprot:758184-Hanusia_phi.AAC.12